MNEGGRARWVGLLRDAGVDAAVIEALGALGEGKSPAELLQVLVADFSDTHVEVRDALVRVLSSRLDSLPAEERVCFDRAYSLLVWRRKPGGDMALAQAHLELRLRSDLPEPGWAHWFLGQTLQRRGFAVEATSELRVAVERFRAAGAMARAGLALLTLGEALALTGRQVEAADALAEALALIDDDRPIIYSKLAEALRRVGAHDAAWTATKRMMEAPGRWDLKDAFAVIQRGSIKLMRGEVEPAGIELRAMSAELPSADEQVVIAWHEAVGCLALAEGDRGAALMHFRCAHETAKDSPHQGRIVRAEILFQIAELEGELEPDRQAQTLVEALRTLDGTEAGHLRTKLEEALRAVDADRSRLHAVGRFVGHARVAQIVSESGRAGFRGEAADVVILFSDLRGFTKLCESIRPDQAVAFLNRYLTLMTACIQEQEGQIDAFEGDGIMALFGLDRPEAAPADRAMLAAIHMHAELSRINRHRGRAPLRMGIGLHAGPVVAGLMGSPGHRKHAVVGDTVNSASRVEGMAKFFGSGIVVSDAILRRSANPDHYVLRPIGRVVPAGRVTPIDVSELMTHRMLAPYLDPGERAEIDACEQALVRFHRRDFEGAEQMYRDLATMCHSPRKQGYDWLADQAARRAATPPPANWAGSVSLTSK